MRSGRGTITGDERGLTLPEMLTVIVIVGILITIAVFVWLSILEARRVDAAARQLAADMRLAHARATNGLTDWRVVLVPQVAGEDEGPDYFLVRLAQPYAGNAPDPEAPPVADEEAPPVARSLPANVRVMTQTRSAGDGEVPITDDPDDAYYLNPLPGAGATTRTLEFNSDGAMTGYGGSPSGTVRVTVDGDPQACVRYTSATSRVRILGDRECNGEEDAS